MGICSSCQSCADAKDDFDIDRTTVRHMTGDNSFEGELDSNGRNGNDITIRKNSKNIYYYDVETEELVEIEEQLEP